jgi:hypothetical protein
MKKIEVKPLQRTGSSLPQKSILTLAINNPNKVKLLPGAFDSHEKMSPKKREQLIKILSDKKHS